MHWLCKCVIGLVMLATTTWSSTVAGVTQKCVPPGPGPSLNNTLYGKSYLYKLEQEFSIKLLQTLATSSNKNNLIFSPHSIYMVILITYFWSNEKNLRSFLHLPPDQDKMSVIQAYRMDKLFLSKRALNTSADYKFSSVNGIFYQYPIEECIAELLKDEMHKIDFAVNPELANKYINNWVSNHTNQIIKDLFPVGMITSRTILVLANAAYFNGYWSSGFDSTENDMFYTSPSKYEYVTMMKKTAVFKISNSSELGSRIIELPYKGGDISLFVILPNVNEEHGISQLSKMLSTNTIQNIVSSSQWRLDYVNVYLPKFNATHTIGDLREVEGSLCVVMVTCYLTEFLIFGRVIYLMTPSFLHFSTRKNTKDKIETL
eukprot:XP_016656659.1 PREDICTED: serpin B3-like isoform X2 [Acyrthosiphon pisum]